MKDRSILHTNQITVFCYKYNKGPIYSLFKDKLSQCIIVHACMHLYTIAHALKIQCHVHAIVGDQTAMTDTHLFNYNDERLHKHACLLGIKITINFLLPTIQI